MSESNLKITTETFKRAALVKAAGRIDSSNAAQFDTVLKDLLAEWQSINASVNRIVAKSRRVA